MSKSHVYTELVLLKPLGQHQASHLGLQMALFSLWLSVIFSSDLESNFLSWKDFSRDGLRPTL